MPPLTRRELLGLAGIGFSTTLTGCYQSSASQDTTITGTTAEPPTTQKQSSTPMETHPKGAGPAPSCPDAYYTFDPYWVVEGPGPLGGFDLTVSPETVAVGDTLTVTLRNVTDNRQESGLKEKYDIQYRGTNGWHTVFGTRDKTFDPPPEIAVTHEPGQGFTWQFPVTKDGLSNITEKPDIYEVCSPIVPRTYRFVYWGITTEREKKENYETDYALGVPFTVTDG